MALEAVVMVAPVIDTEILLIHGSTACVAFRIRLVEVAIDADYVRTYWIVLHIGKVSLKFPSFVINQSEFFTEDRYD